MAFAGIAVQGFAHTSALSTATTTDKDATKVTGPSGESRQAAIPAAVPLEHSSTAHVVVVVPETYRVRVSHWEKVFDYQGNT